MNSEVALYLIKDMDYKTFRIGSISQDGVTKHLIWLFDNPNIPKKTLEFTDEEIISTMRDSKLTELGI